MNILGLAPNIALGTETAQDQGLVLFQGARGLAESGQ